MMSSKWVGVSEMETDLDDWASSYSPSHQKSLAERVCTVPVTIHILRTSDLRYKLMALLRSGGVQHVQMRKGCQACMAAVRMAPQISRGRDSHDSHQELVPSSLKHSIYAILNLRSDLFLQQVRCEVYRPIRKALRCCCTVRPCRPPRVDD